MNKKLRWSRIPFYQNLVNEEQSLFFITYNFISISNILHEVFFYSRYLHVYFIFFNTPNKFSE